MGRLFDTYGRLAISIAGIYSCYLMYGIYQEALYRPQSDGTQFSATAFVLCFQCATNALVAMLGHLLREHHGGGAAERQQRKVSDAASPVCARVPWYRALSTSAVAKTATVYVLAMYTSNEALAFVSYPTQALVKSCKMIPVMIGSILINRVSYPLIKYICVALMSAGIAWFQLARPPKAAGAHGPMGGAGASTHFGPFAGEALGMLLLGASLCLDGVTGPMQVRTGERGSRAQAQCV